MDTISGYIDHITFRNEENGYTVAQIITDDGELTCVGQMPSFSAGETIEAEGEYMEHQTYGRQFKVLSMRSVAPKDEISLLRYLGSGAVKGVGEKLAERIVKKFGEDTMRIIEEEPERLAEVKGVSERMARSIADQMAGRRDERNAFMFLQQYGLSQTLIKKLYDKYGPSVYRVIKENPYRMAEEVPQVGFATADEIASRAGIKTDSEYRVRSGLLYVLRQTGARGHCYYPEEKLFEELSELLGLSGEQYGIVFSNALESLMIDGFVSIKQSNDEKRIYLRSYESAERYCASKLLMLRDAFEPFSSEEDTERFLAARELSGIERDELQEKAVKECLSSGVFILSGGPGTGKTTTINTIIDCFEQNGIGFALAAPTGRAAKRMTESSGVEAQTIHRLLEISGDASDDSAPMRFMRNEDNPLEVEAVIADETSMLDIFLLKALLSAMEPGMQLIFVGDADQLPSVGPGRVLNDMLESGAFNSVILKRIFRQSAESHIVTYAHMINEGRHIDLSVKYPDFFLLEKESPEMIQRYLVQLCSDVIPRKLGLSKEDVQILTPMRKGPLGAVTLNTVLQRALNPPADDKAEALSGGTLFREGDKVMQIRNDYNLEWEVRGNYNVSVREGKGVFNGDVGEIRQINPALKLAEVEFDEGKRVYYSFEKLEELDLSYAVTIHKSQGSEYPVVILPLFSGPDMLMTRNLLYTAVTRGKQCVIIVGKNSAVQEMTDRGTENERYTSLKERLCAGMG